MENVENIINSNKNYVYVSQPLLWVIEFVTLRARGFSDSLNIENGQIAVGKGVKCVENKKFCIVFSAVCEGFHYKN